MADARAEILARIRTALGRDELGPDRTVGAGAGAGEEIPRHYTLRRDYADLLGLFVERVSDYRATVRRVSESEVADAVGDAVSRRGGQVLMPVDLPERWRPADVELVADRGQLTHAELDAAAGVVTGCAVGIAETGTIVLDAAAGQGRRALSLVPDYHLCLVRAEQVVATVPEALARLDPTRPLTFISGPSATSDIELDRVEGVHGPRTLEVLLIAETPAD